MGSAGTKTGVGAAGGALAGSAFGPIGAGIGALAGGALGYFSPDAPKPPTIAPTDPRLEAERATAEADTLRALQTQATGDTASLMARYGTRLALASASSGSPIMMATAATQLGKAA